MKEQLISFETAKLAKEKGFKKKVRYSYVQPVITKRGTSIKEAREYKIEKTINKTYNSFVEISYPNESFSAPTQSLLQKWLREKYNIHLLIEPYYDEQRVLAYGFDLIIEKSEEETLLERGFETYEEALEVGLQEALKLVG